MSAPIEVDRCCDCRRSFAQDERPGECVIHPGGSHHRMPCLDPQAGIWIERFVPATH